MSRWKVISFLLVLALLAPVLSAQHVEITPFAGFRFGGEFEVTIDDVDGDTPFARFDQNLEAGVAYGLIIDIALTEKIQLELLFDRQESTLENDPTPRNVEEVNLPLEVDYYHLGALYQWPKKKLVPFVVGSLGVTSFSPEPSSVSGESYFSWGFGAGIKIPFHPVVGLRFEGRIYGTFIDDEDEFLCDDLTYPCFNFDDNDTLLQGEIRGGVVFRF